MLMLVYDESFYLDPRYLQELLLISIFLEFPRYGSRGIVCGSA